MKLHNNKNKLVQGLAWFVGCAFILIGIISLFFAFLIFTLSESLGKRILGAIIFILVGILFLASGYFLTRISSTSTHVNYMIYARRMGMRRLK